MDVEVKRLLERVRGKASRSRRFSTELGTVGMDAEVKRLLEGVRGKASRSKFDMIMKCNNRVDRISQLPDGVIVHVLSFLPLKSAVATSALSHRWTDLWKYIPNLKFKDFYLQRELYHLYKRVDYITHEEYQECELRMHKYIDWVNSVLQSHTASSLQCFTVVVLVDKSTQHQVTKWLEFAFSRHVKRLKLISDQFWANAGVLAEMLKDMSIPSSNFKSLKVLRLKGFRMSSEAIEFLLRNCTLLEMLVLKMSTFTSDLVVRGSLKHLDMCMPFNKNSVKVCAPNLTWLTIDHDSKKVSLENVPKLVSMRFYCRTSDTMRDYAKIARQLETLIITLVGASASFSVPVMPKLKKLVVYYCCQEDNNVLFPVTCLIRACPVLEEFKIDVGEHGVWSEIFQIPKDGPPVHDEHRHLRRFVLSGFCGGARDRMELVRYMVSYCVALEEIVVGQCDRKDFVDRCVPLDHVIWGPMATDTDYVATPQERLAIKKAMRLFTPWHIKLRVV